MQSILIRGRFQAGKFELLLLFRERGLKVHADLGDSHDDWPRRYGERDAVAARTRLVKFGPMLRAASKPAATSPRARNAYRLRHPRRFVFRAGYFNIDRFGHRRRSDKPTEGKMLCSEVL